MSTLAGLEGLLSVRRIFFTTEVVEENNQEKHPDRKCLDIKIAADYIKWLIDQPKHVNINELSIDPIQERKV